MRIHVVSQGEHLLEIAGWYGADPDAIWALAENKPLKDGGRTPEILAPGDLVRIPEVTPTAFALQIGQTNAFTAPLDPTVDVAVKLTGPDGEGVSNEPYEIDPLDCEVEGLDMKGNTGDDGSLTFRKLPLDLKSIIVRLPQRGVTLQVKVGHLDPVTTPSGKAQRLAHLGYLLSGSIRVSSDGIADALAAFAADCAPDAQSDADIEQALLKAHGL